MGWVKWIGPNPGMHVTGTMSGKKLAETYDMFYDQWLPVYNEGDFKIFAKKDSFEVSKGINPPAEFIKGYKGKKKKREPTEKVEYHGEPIGGG